METARCQAYRVREGQKSNRRASQIPAIIDTLITAVRNGELNDHSTGKEILISPRQVFQAIDDP
jgi:hypothetical protein